MKKFLAVLMLIASVVLGQEAQIKEQLSLDSELKTIAKHLDNIVEESKKAGRTDAEREAIECATLKELSYIKFFTSYNLPRNILEDSNIALSLILNHTASINSDAYIEKPKKLTDTIQYIDIRDFGWTLEQFEAVMSIDPYVVDPLVDHRLYNYVRLRYGNNLLRTDWFVVNASDITKQVDRGEDKILIYNILLYGLGNEPKTADEFRNFWHVDIKTIRAQKVEQGTIVDEGDSGVSRHTRQLRRGNSLFGYYWETRDVKDYEQKKAARSAKLRDKFVEKDFIEDIFANNFDAQEYIASHKNGTQVYLLSNGEGKVVNFADNTIVVDRSDTNDVRVRTAKSCITCHAVGINPATNALTSLLKRGGKIYFQNDELRRAIKSFYERNLNTLIEDDNRVFQRHIKECYHTEPDSIEAARAFTNVYDWYVNKLSPEQAAIECGVSLPEYKEYIRPLTTGRLAQLYKNTNIPRKVWDSVGPGGGYTQSMLLIKKVDLAKIAEEAAQIKIPSILITRYHNVPVQNDKGKIVVYIKEVGTAIPYEKIEGPWYKVKYQGHDGWIYSEHIENQK
jgi:hypothetical protein